MTRASQTKSKLTDDAPHLTEMEERVLRLISLGCTIKKTAAILGRSPSTIDGHKSNIMRKLRVHNLPMLTRRALQLKVSSLDDALTRSERWRWSRWLNQH